MLELSRDILVRDDADRYFWAVAYRNLYVKVCAIFARAMKLSDNGWRKIRYPFIPVYSIDDATLLKTEFGKKKTFVTFFFRHSSRSNSYRWYTISLPQRVDLINFQQAAAIHLVFEIIVIEFVISIDFELIVFFRITKILVTRWFDNNRFNWILLSTNEIFIDFYI